MLNASPPILLRTEKKCPEELFVSLLIYDFSFSFYNSTPFLSHSSLCILPSSEQGDE